MSILHSAIVRVVCTSHDFFKTSAIREKQLEIGKGESVVTGSLNIGTLSQETLFALYSLEIALLDPIWTWLV